MGTATTPRRHGRDGLPFASDLTGAEWAVIEPLLAPPAAVGRAPRRPMREIVDAIFYALRGGIPWRMLPPCFPPRQTDHGWFAAWRGGGGWRSIAFVEICSTPTRMECDRSISGPPAPVGPTSPCPRPGRKQTALARSGGLRACGETSLDRPRARGLLVCRQ
ncbi:MAG: transposase [Methylocella sp.]